MRTGTWSYSWLPFQDLNKHRQNQQVVKMHVPGHFGVSPANSLATFDSVSKTGSTIDFKGRSWERGMHNTEVRCVPACSVVSDSAAPWTVALLSMGFSKQEYWRVLHFSLQGIFLTQLSNPRLLCLLHCRWILYPWANVISSSVLEGNRHHSSLEMVIS